MVVQQLSRHLCTRVSNFHFFMSKSKFSSPLNTSPHSKFQWRVERNRKVKNVWKNFATRRHTRRAASACRTHESLEQTTQKKLQLMTKKMQMRRSRKMVMTAILVFVCSQWDTTNWGMLPFPRNNLENKFSRFYVFIFTFYTSSSNGRPGREEALGLNRNQTISKKNVKK